MNSSSEEVISDKYSELKALIAVGKKLFITQQLFEENDL